MAGPRDGKVRFCERRAAPNATVATAVSSPENRRSSTPRTGARWLSFFLPSVLALGCTSNPGTPGGQSEQTGGTPNQGGAPGTTAGSTASGGAGAVGAGGTSGGAGGGLAGNAGAAGRPDGAGGQAASGGNAGAGSSGRASGGRAGGAGRVNGGGGRDGGSGAGGMRSGAGGAGASGAAGTGAAGAAGSGTGSAPCDIYATGNAPCVAAHSTVRALFGAYRGKLYQVQRASDKTTTDIGVTSDGFADAAAQDTFCSGTKCTIPIIYDQAGKNNDLTVAPAGGNGSADVAADAAGLKLTVSGHSVYAIYVAAGVGYRNNKTTGIATGSGAEGEYMVASGKHVNDGCCFDYGNAETNSKDNGNGHMEAIYLGKLCWFTPCNGDGPWVMADLENGLFAGGNGTSKTNTSVPYDYVTALLKGDSKQYSLRGGNAQSGDLQTMYAGNLPTTTGYNPMHKEGALILGIGGDNSKVAVGTFFEGAVTSGYPSDATEDAVQANVIGVGYGK